MSTNIGLNLTTNFKKNISPIVLNSYDLITNNEDINNIGDFSEFLNSESLTNKILRVIQSLDNHDTTESIEIDNNPLDNIIRSELIELLEYRKISKTKIQQSLDLISEGQEPHLIFSAEENIILLNQARKLEFLKEEQYINLIGNPISLYSLYPIVYRKLLEFQLNLPNNIPTIDELKIAGMVNFIIETVKENPENVIDENLIKYYTKNYIDDILLTSEFIGYSSINSILADPEYILSILGKTTFYNLVKRVQPYLNFITDTKIQTVMEFIPSQYPNIVNVFTKEQIRLMIEKELDIKDLIFKTLSLNEVQTVFNDLTEQFKVDFSNTFTEEKLIELIELTIEKLYPEEELNKIYKQICINYNIDDTTINIEGIEQKLQNYFN